MNPEERREKLVALATDRRVQLLVVIFFVALVPRIAFMEHGLWQDEGRAMTTARNVLQGDGFTFREKPMTQHPFVFYILLAVSFLFLGATDFAGILLVNVLGALTAVVAYLIGEELYGRYTGIAAAAFMAFNPIHWLISIRVLNDVPVTFFMTLAAYLFIRSEREESSKLFYAAAATAGLATLTKLSGAIIIPVFALYALYNHRMDAFSVRRYWIGAGVFVALFAVWELRNLIMVNTLASVDVFKEAVLTPQTGALDRSKDPLYYVVNLHRFLGIPALLAFLTGLAASYLYGLKRAHVFLFIYLGVVLATFTIKTSNLLRYFLPFAPFAVVMAGYGVERVSAVAGSLVNERAGQAAFALIILASLALMAPSGAARLQAQQGGFFGLQEAGDWMEQRTEPGDTIMAASVNQIAWYTDRDRVRNLWPVDNQSQVDAYVQEHDVQFIEWDIFEPLVRTYAPYAPQYYIQSDNYRVVKVQRRTIQGQQQPYLIIFQPVFNETGAATPTLPGLQ